MKYILLISVLLFSCRSPEDISNCVSYCTKNNMQYSDSHRMFTVYHLICECKIEMKLYGYPYTENK
jgi:hypothetical protein